MTKKKRIEQPWSCSPALRRLRQKNWELGAKPDDTARHCREKREQQTKSRSRENLEYASWSRVTRIYEKRTFLNAVAIYIGKKRRRGQEGKREPDGQANTDRQERKGEEGGERETQREICTVGSAPQS